MGSEAPSPSPRRLKRGCPASPGGPASISAPGCPLSPSSFPTCITSVPILALLLFSWVTLGK